MSRFATFRSLEWTKFFYFLIYRINNITNWPRIIAIPHSRYYNLVPNHFWLMPPNQPLFPLSSVWQTYQERPTNFLLLKLLTSIRTFDIIYESSLISLSFDKGSFFLLSGPINSNTKWIYKEFLVVHSHKFNELLFVLLHTNQVYEKRFGKLN